MSAVQIFIPEGYPKKVEAEKKYVVYGMEITTSDGTVHTAPVSEFRYGDDSPHFTEQEDEAENLKLLQACIHMLALRYEEGACVGMNVSQQQIIESNGWTDCPAVELPITTAVDGGVAIEFDSKTPMEVSEVTPDGEASESLSEGTSVEAEVSDAVAASASEE